LITISDLLTRKASNRI